MTLKKPLKEVKAPPLEIDSELIALAVRAELAVVKAEEEKKKEDEMIITLNSWGDKKNKFLYMYYEPRILYKCYRIKNWYSEGYLNHQKQELTKRLIRSIILSLGIGYSLSFIINNL